jgi:hypothetical protein
VTLNREKFSGRTSAFGLPMRPLSDIKSDINRCLASASRQREKLARPTTGVYNLKRLRSNLAHAMLVDVIFQPVLVKPKKASKSKLIDNPIWDLAPKGAYYKAKRLCSLLQPIVTHGSKAPIGQDLVRLAINIWRMSKRHFDGLIRQIRSKIVKSASRPEALVRIGALTNNPVLSDRVFWYTRYQQKHPKGVDAAKLLSTNVEIVRRTLRLGLK